MLRRERRLQDELFYILREIVREKRFAGLELDVSTEFPVGGKKADIVVFKKFESTPVLIIETKRKVERRGYRRVDEKFDPYGRPAIAQALSYAALAKDEYRLHATPLFATATWDAIALFSPVEDPWKYLDRRSVEEGEYEEALEPDAYVRLIHNYYILSEKNNPLRQEFLEYVLDTACRVWQREVAAEEVRRPFGEWLIESLRYFVDFLSSCYVTEVLRRRLIEDPGFLSELNRKALESGYKNGIVDIIEEDYGKTYVLARMMVYTLLNKIVFYKVLERAYRLPELKPLLQEGPATSSEDYLSRLNKYFEEAVKTTKDFEPIFYTGLFDSLVLSDEVNARREIDELIRLLSTVEIEEFGDVIGYVYEDLIPAGERHQMGEFYTPPPIAELIVKWCVRSPSDYVLDPGCGSGTFLVQAYWRLVELKTGRRRIPARDVHTSTLRQLYAIDINPFPAQLTAMNLGMKNVRIPTTEANIILSDFFTIIPKQEVLASHPVVTLNGIKPKVIKLPEENFDAVVGNPPYTRWTEIPEPVRENIKKRLGDILSQYNLHADVQRGKEPCIYIHFIMWAREFLKPGGRLGMIISGSWLQTDYGIDFGRYLLENFRVKALIDISARVFPVPLVGACIILLEKPLENENVNDNETVLMYLNVPEGGSLRVDEILEILRKPEEATKATGQYRVKIVKQGELPRDKKWINFIFNTEEILSELRSKTIPVGRLFDVSYGNATYLYLASKGKVHGPRNLGASSFFYLNREKIERWGLEGYAYPAITSSRHVKFFSFTEGDWREIRDGGGECYIFICHKPKEELSENVLRYITWGETECRTQIRETRGGGRPCHLAQACQERERQKQYFHGWYDLGGVMYAPILAIRQSQYKTRFIWNKINAVTYDAMIAFIPKDEVKLTETKVKALLAYFNSSFIQLYIESIARTTGMGVAALEVKNAEEMPIINVNSMDGNNLRELADLFDRLDSEARRLRGADKRENIERLWDTVIAEIDRKVAEILQLPEHLPEAARSLAMEMMKRRLARAEEARPTIIKGTTEEPKFKKTRRREKSSRRGSDAKLNHFMV
jgi:type I restriction-modification system DNA methylase subunit